MKEEVNSEEEVNSDIDPGICWCPCTTDQPPLSNNAPIKWKL